MPDTLHLPPEARQAILEHCTAAAPAEGCGLFAVSDGVVKAVYPTGNDAVGLDSFVIPPAEHYAALEHAEDHGLELGGSFHSHPRGEAVPSPTDVAGALDPRWVHLVVGPVIGPAREPLIRAWRIRSGTVSEVALLLH